MSWDRSDGPPPRERAGGVAQRRRGLLLAGLAWTGANAALWFGQERLLFKPVPLPPDAALSSEPDVSERFVDVPGRAPFGAGAAPAETRRAWSSSCTGTAPT